MIRMLRPHADRIVATMYGNNRLAARICSAANSRLVDRRYHVPNPTRDWQAGRIQLENTKAEQDYLDAILDICRREAIDAPILMPSRNAVSRSSGMRFAIPWCFCFGPIPFFEPARAAGGSGEGRGGWLLDFDGVPMRWDWFGRRRVYQTSPEAPIALAAVEPGSDG